MPKTWENSFTPGELILMVYDGAIEYLKKAEEMLNKGDTEGRRNMLFRAQDCINELMCNLNMEAGEIANNLYHLYDYSNRMISQAYAQGEGEPIREVIDLLSELKEGWKGAVQKVEGTFSYAQ